MAPLFAMVRKDLLLFFGDRRSVILSFVVPIAIASFFGSIFSDVGDDSAARINVAVVDLDNSTISKAIAANAAADSNFALTNPGEATARDEVRRGKISVAVIIPPGFGDAAGRAFLNLGKQPELGLLYDPSHRTELAMVGGILTQHVMQAVSAAMLGGSQGRALLDESVARVEPLSAADSQQTALLQMLRSVQTYNNQAAAPQPSSAPGATPGGLLMPYVVREEAVTSGSNVKYNGYAHSFAGMGVQFLLFAMANLGIEMLLERQRGLWKRLRSAPVSRTLLLGGKVVSGSIISLVTLWVSFAFAMIVFDVRIEGSVLGFVAVSVACALMAATFGLLVAAVGRTPASARAVTTLAVLMMVMLGGAWVPAFIFPQWLQQATKVVPVRWAVDGLDAMTWRGLGFSGAIAPTLVLLGFAMVFGMVAAARFRWEE
ncbi:MAG: ABC transporter permease [Longimicrobiales bacterium]